MRRRPSVCRYGHLQSRMSAFASISDVRHIIFRFAKRTCPQLALHFFYANWKTSNGERYAISILTLAASPGARAAPSPCSRTRLPLSMCAGRRFGCWVRRSGRIAGCTDVRNSMDASSSAHLTTAGLSGVPTGSPTGLAGLLRPRPRAAMRTAVRFSPANSVRRMPIRRLS